MSHTPMYDCVILGAGLTGLSCAHRLQEADVNFVLLESEKRTGGQIRTYQEADFTFESGPNTGIISTPEVAELFDAYPGLLQTARAEAKRRLILKKGQFHPLPSGLKSALSTRLFSTWDKFRILAEPFRKKGKDPNESIASLVRRRLGESYYRYAVNPFVGGIYAGDPDKLVTRHALPRLYALEAEHGSFVRGAMAVMRRPKTERDRRASKEVFSARGGLSALTDAITQTLSEAGRLHLGAQHIRLQSEGARLWRISYEQDGQSLSLYTRQVITTIGTQDLEAVLSPLGEDLSPIMSMRYAPIVQVALGYRVAPAIDFEAFGGLIPSHENDRLLGILNLSACFEGRTPKGGLLLSAFLGGMRAPTLITESDQEIQGLVLDCLSTTINLRQAPDLLRIFRHERAIPQYEADTDQRLDCIRALERKYPGLHIGGNMLGGIGMPDRIKQGFTLAEAIIADLDRSI